MLRLVRIPDERDRTVSKRPLEPEIVTQFLGNEGKHRQLASATTQEIDAAMAQLASARTCEREPEAAIFDGAMNFVEERG